MQNNCVVHKRTIFMSNLKKAFEIERVGFSRMLKLEVPELALEVRGIVEKHDPELLQIDFMFDLLVSKSPVISKLKAPYGVDPLRLALIPLREKLMLKASKIKLHLKVLNKSTDKKDLFIVQTAVDRHLLHLYKSKNPKVLNQKIAGFLDDVENDEALATALQEYNFMKLIDDLKLTLREVRQLSGERGKVLSERPKETSNQLITELADAIEKLFNEIELAQFKNPEIDYEPLVRELNVLMKNYRTSIKLREARNKRLAAEKNGEETEVEEGDSTEVQITAEDNNGTIITPLSYVASINELNAPTVEEPKAPAPTNGSGSEKNNAEGLDQKKTVAETGNLSQQSLSSSSKSSNDNA